MFIQLHYRGGVAKSEKKGGFELRLPIARPWQSMSGEIILSIEAEPTAAHRTTRTVQPTEVHAPARVHFKCPIRRHITSITATACSAPLQSIPPSRRRIMSPASFWTDACNDAKDRPLQTKLNAAYGSCGATVRRARAAACVLRAAV